MSELKVLVSGFLTRMKGSVGTVNFSSSERFDSLSQLNIPSEGVIDTPSPS